MVIMFIYGLTTLVNILEHLNFFMNFAIAKKIAPNLKFHLNYFAEYPWKKYL